MALTEGFLCNSFVKSDVDKHIVRKTLHGYYQLTRTQVNMEQLKNLIYQHPIENEDVHNERLYGSSKVLYTKKELEAKIQCSLSELETALSKLEVFELDGKLRVLSATTEHAIAKNIVLTINAEGLTLDSLNKDEVLAKCNQNSIFPQLFIDFVVHLYLRPSSTAMDVDSHSSKYSFDISRYNALSARLLLIEKPNWMLSELLSTWKDSVPDNFPIDVAQLDGLVCLEEYGKDHKVTYLPSFSLSHNPKTRFSELFKRKPKWTFGQLKPYLQDLVTPDINEEQLLVAHTRASTGPNGQKLYSAR